MRRFGLIILLLCSILTKAQDLNDSVPNTIPELKNVVKSNPIALAWGTVPYTAEFRLCNEIPITQRQSVQISVSYLGKGPILYFLEDSLTGGNIRFTVFGGRIQYQHRYYFKLNRTGIATHKVLLGWYLAPHVSYAKATVSTRQLRQYELYYRATQFNTALLIGKQSHFGLFKNGTLDVFAGLGYKNNSWIDNTRPGQKPRHFVFGAAGPSYNSNFKLYLGFNFGLAF